MDQQHRGPTESEPHVNTPPAVWDTLPTTSHAGERPGPWGPGPVRFTAPTFCSLPFLPTSGPFQFLHPECNRCSCCAPCLPLTEGWHSVDSPGLLSVSCWRASGSLHIVANARSCPSSPSPQCPGQCLQQLGTATRLDDQGKHIMGAVGEAGCRCNRVKALPGQLCSLVLLSDGSCLPAHHLPALAPGPCGYRHSLV